MWFSSLNIKPIFSLLSESLPRSADHRDSQPTSEAEKEDEGKNKLESLAESFFRQRQQQQTQPQPDDGEGSPEDGDDAPPDGESDPAGEEVSGGNFARSSVHQLKIQIVISWALI